MECIYITLPNTVGSSFRKVPDLCMVGAAGTGAGFCWTSTLLVVFLGDTASDLFIGDGLRTLLITGDVTLLSSFRGELVRLSLFNGELQRLSGRRAFNKGDSFLLVLEFLDTVTGFLEGVCFALVGWGVVLLLFAGFVGGFRGADLIFLDGADLAALAAVGWVKVLPTENDINYSIKYFWRYDIFTMWILWRLISAIGSGAGGHLWCFGSQQETSPQRWATAGRKHSSLIHSRTGISWRVRRTQNRALLGFSICNRLLFVKRSGPWQTTCRFQTGCQFFYTRSIKNLKCNM